MPAIAMTNRQLHHVMGHDRVRVDGSILQLGFLSWQLNSVPPVSANPPGIFFVPAVLEGAGSMRSGRRIWMGVANHLVCTCGVILPYCLAPLWRGFFWLADL